MTMPTLAADAAAALHILSAPTIKHRVAPHISADDVDWRSLLALAPELSGGEFLLVRIAYELWEARLAVGLWEITRRLDSENFQRVIEALTIAHTGKPVPVERLALPRLTFLPAA